MIPNRQVLEQTQTRMRQMEPLPPRARSRQAVGVERELAGVERELAGADEQLAGSERELAPAPRLPRVPDAAALSAPRSVRAPATGREVTPVRRAHLSFAGAEPTPAEHERILGTNDLVDEFYLHRALVAARPVCRVVLRGPTGRELGFATGFLVAPRLMLTNWHVLETAEMAAHGVAELGYTLDIAGNPCTSCRFALRPDLFFHADRTLDYALVAVQETSMGDASALSRFGFHRLVAETSKIVEGEWITIIQHPGGARRQFSIRENELHSRDDQVLWYFSDTAQGSSGAPAFNDSFQIVALHHSGRARRDGELYVLKDGRRVASIADVDDSAIDWEVNEGIRISRICRHLAQTLPPGDPYTQELFAAMKDGGDVMSRSLSGIDPSPASTPSAATAAREVTRPSANAYAGATVVLNVGQIHVAQVTVEGPRAPAPAATAGIAPPVAPPRDDEVGREKYVQPVIDTRYSNRAGYRENFLGRKKALHVPLPKVTDMDLVSKLDDGDHVIPYEHFSIVMHRHRRLALFTAANVDGRPKYREPEPGDYSRKALSGLGKSDIEKWATDERIPAKHQLPDTFYTKDGGAFDRGHVVRRDDVCWGRTRAQIVRANGDSFHVTNCSPQVSGYNQSSKGGLWGKLENHVLSQAEDEEQKLCVLAGPVFDDDDPWFQGRDDVGSARVQIPRRYWKIVVAREGDALQAFAFLLEQSLEKVPLTEEEGFTVGYQWRPSLISIEDLQTWLVGFQLPKAVRDADRSGDEPGQELAKRAEIGHELAGARRAEAEEPDEAPAPANV